MVRRLGLERNNHLTYASLALNPRYIKLFLSLLARMVDIWGLRCWFSESVSSVSVLHFSFPLSNLFKAVSMPFPVSNLFKSISDRYRPDRDPVGLITVRYRFRQNAKWFHTSSCWEDDPNWCLVLCVYFDTSYDHRETLKFVYVQ